MHENKHLIKTDDYMINVSNSGGSRILGWGRRHRVEARQTPRAVESGKGCPPPQAVESGKGVVSLSIKKVLKFYAKIMHVCAKFSLGYKNASSQ